MGQFINPYAFVSFKKDIKRKKVEDLANEKKYTGSIEYTISPKTPLIIPNTSTKEFNLNNNVSNSYGIYSYEDLQNQKAQSSFFQPIIPGSEIRGCIRNVYEALTSSCYNFKDESDIYFSERVNANSSYKPCVLMNVGEGKWQLYEADKYNDRLLVDDQENINKDSMSVDIPGYGIFKAFEKFYADFGQIGSDDEDEGMDFSHELIRGHNCKEAYLYIGNKNTDGNQVISGFVKKGSPLTTIIKDDDNYKRLVAGIESFKDENGNCTYQRFLDALDNNKCIPIHYEACNFGLYRFSPAQIGRKVFTKSVTQKLGSASRCDGDELCPTCLLFGRVNKDKSLAGRVRFADATIKNYKYNPNNYIDLISGTPHPSNIDMYSREQRGIDWDSDNTLMAGRKFYWHHNPDMYFIKNKVNGNENTKIKSRYYYIDNKQLETTNNKFKGKIYFDDITLEELNNLYKAICLVDNNHMHKLGHGKPFGFGSCNFEILNVNSNDITKEELDKDLKWLDTDKELEYILDFNALKQYINQNIKITYPFSNDPLRDKGYEWFSNNKRPKQILQHLPSLLDSFGNRKKPTLNTNTSSKDEKKDRKVR